MMVLCARQCRRERENTEIADVLSVIEIGVLQRVHNHFCIILNVHASQGGSCCRVMAFRGVDGWYKHSRHGGGSFMHDVKERRWEGGEWNTIRTYSMCGRRWWCMCCEEVGRCMFFTCFISYSLKADDIGFIVCKKKYYMSK